MEGQVAVTRKGRRRALIVRVGTDPGQGDHGGYIVTFDDVTELVAAQRTAAWADVARRIAHEIKNPLTPIQLSAERLKRKYGKEVSSDPEIFDQCTDTIIRQVGDIGRMVDEFSAFARMPAPVLRNENLNDLVQQSLFAQRVARPDIDYRLEAPDGPVMLRCDGRQVSQVLTNVLQNAAEAVGSPVISAEGKAPDGQIVTRIELKGSEVAVEVIDNGCGFPAEDRDRLTEPYVTTRANGTGLGLAIAKKIMEDHGGHLVLEDADTGGARVRLEFLIEAGETSAVEPEASPEKMASHGT